MSIGDQKAAMAGTDDLERIILDFICEQILAAGELELDPEENLFTSGHVDSLGIMRLIGHLETTFELEIPLRDRVPSNFRTVRVMAAYLQQQLEARS
jgi:acyl carrier protein